MHKITGDRDVMMRLMRSTIHQLGLDHPKAKKVGMAALAVKSESAWPGKRDQLVETLKRAYDRMQERIALKASAAAIPNQITVDSSFAPRDRTLALFQSAMDEYLDEQLARKKPKRIAASTGKTKTADQGVADKEAPLTIETFLAKAPAKKKKKAALATAKALFEQFDNLDPRWIEVVWEKSKLLFKGKRKFISHKSATDFRFPLSENATIAIVGDWGGGNAAAQAVAEQIKSLNPAPDHIVHLGDVYYAGTEKEVKERFLKYWPAPVEGGSSFALNSNHEMYSGGYAYFNLTLKQFKQPASYFSLENQNWRFIGLDTGYVDHDLNKEQVDWLSAQFKGKNQKTILLTHHQLFSAYENTDAANLQSRVQPFLDAGKIYAWIWGHEHLLVVYKEHMGIKARCLGNGCFPYNPPSKAPQVPVEWLDNRPQVDDDDYKGMHSFALLTINGQAINIKYIDQDGEVGFEETWR